MKLLGLIGGTSYHSTLEYYKAINEGVSKYIGLNANPELLLYSINIDVMRRQDINEINSTYLDVATKLQKAGANALMICANTPHMAIEYVQPNIQIPFLHIGQSTGVEAKLKGYKKLLLLGNRPTMTKKFLKQYLVENFDLEIFTPAQTEIDKSHHYVSQQLTQGLFSEEAKHFYTQLIETYQHKVDAVVLGCTELPILLRDTSAKLPFLKTTDLHINSAINFILDK